MPARDEPQFREQTIALFRAAISSAGSDRPVQRRLQQGGGGTGTNAQAGMDAKDADAAARVRDFVAAPHATAT